MGETESKGLLSGVKVVELATFVAAPSATRYMSHFGADVIKVEDTRGGGDALRTLCVSLNMPKDEYENPLYDEFNGCKRSIALNLKDEQAKVVLGKLLEDADVFVVNVREKGLEKLGLDYETLKEKYPRLIYAQVNGYGDAGPRKDDPAFDIAAFWAATGFTNDLSLDVGSGLTQPVDSPSGVGDTTTGCFLFAAIVSALYARERTGKGDRVTVSLYGVASWVMSLLSLSTQEKYGRKYPRSHRTCTPPAFKCADGRWINVTLMANWSYYFPQFCKAMDMPELEHDPRFAKDEDYVRPENAVQFTDIFDPIFLTKTSDEWMKLFNEYNIVCAVLGHFSEISTSEQAWANGYMVNHTMPNGEQCAFAVPPFRSNNMATEGYKYGRAPLLGENSIEIMHELGVSQDVIDGLIERGASVQHEPCNAPTFEEWKPEQ